VTLELFHTMREGPAGSIAPFSYHAPQRALDDLKQRKARRAPRRLRRVCDQDFLATGTGTPAILILNEPRLARVQK
jgi:hypothetical protein